ncbi:prephenate dehydrogenase [Athalassotoga saccharophila]|uniref:prephenate dehydrogenase n=1 Tax=Athalassotoga saccharophila TaxID=1441386 RepID=UPI00137A8F72|nr:prephenate dehydrogenase [Athalassotoga saccharophila]BBJ28732.1 cyclohexadienyl dehydrogenase [Athalassotoga saccharophila]
MKIAVVGLGQIGGSIALRLRKRGYDPDLFDTNCELARSLGGRCSTFSGHGYDVVVLALYPDVILNMMDNLPKDNLYLDTASVKVPVVKKATEIGLNFVGGHPIAGSERVGKDSWDENLFEGRPFALVETPNSKMDIAIKFVEILGSRPVIVDAEYHDRALAHTSQGLYFISKVIKSLGTSYEGLSGPGYASMTRLSNQNPLLGESFKRYNSKNISQFLNEVIEELKKISEELK